MDIHHKYSTPKQCNNHHICNISPDITDCLRSNIQVRILLDHNHYICPICGRKINKDQKLSVDHFFPRTIYKWTNSQEAKNIIENKTNMFYTHPTCNLSKNDDIPNIAQIQKLYTDEKTKQQLYKIRYKLKPHIEQYKQLKKATLKKQKYRCISCHRSLFNTKCTIRRKIHELERSPENAVCVCKNCNSGKYEIFRKMQTKKGCRT